MRLIDEGYDYTVASQGTAFGVAHVEILKKLGVTQVYLAFDADHAGIQAAIKVGELFMQQQISVHVVGLPPGQDPDSFLQANGKKAFDELLLAASSYLEFVYAALKKNYDLEEPSEKNRLIQDIKKKIQDFKDPILIHESLKKLAQIADIPERLLGIYHTKSLKQPVGSSLEINKEHIQDIDVLRFFYLAKQQQLSAMHLFEKRDLEFSSPQATNLYEAIKKASQLEMMPFLAELDQDLHPLFESLFEKKINRMKLEESAKQAIFKLMERSWLKQRQLVQEEIEKADNEKIS